MKKASFLGQLSKFFTFCILIFIGHAALAQNFVLSNLWTINAGTQPFMTIGATERGISYNPVSSHLLLVSRASGLATSPFIGVLDSSTGASNANLSVTGVLTSGPQITFSMNMIGVADDGAIYACDLTQPSANNITNNFVIYRWADESSAPTIAFQGAVDPIGARYGDNFDVRGSGVNTTIIAGQGTAGNGTAGHAVAFFTTTDGVNFTAKTVTNSTAINNDFNRGISFGAGNTIYSKGGGATILKYSGFNVAASTSVVSNSYTGLDANLGPLTVNGASNLLAYVRYSGSTSTNQFVSLYTLGSDPLIAPNLQDTKAFQTNIANGNGAGSLDFGGNKLFALNTQNGLMAFAVVPAATATPPSFSAQPQSQSAYVGAPNVTFTTTVVGTAPFTYRWQQNGANIAGAAGAGPNLVLSNITSAMQGSYTLLVTNAAGSTNSTVATLTVSTPFNTDRLNPNWTLLPLSRTYLGDSDFAQRGLAYNPLTGNLLLASRTPTNLVVVLNSTNGAEKNFLNVDSTVITAGGSITYPLNVIGVADDGIVYGLPLVTAGSAAAFRLYAWNDDTAASAPQLAFLGDPGSGSNLRWGDSLAVRGGGATTQLLMGPGTGSTVTILTTPDGLNFNINVINVTENGNPVASGFAQLGLAWGAGDSFWAKALGGTLRQVQVDIANGGGIVVNSFATTNSNNPTTAATAIAVDPVKNRLAALTFENPDNVRFYDTTSLGSLTFLDQELFTVKNSNGNFTGALAFGGGQLFVLDSNNGVKSFLINTNTQLNRFPITSAVNQGGNIVLTWQSVPGHSYQVVYKDSLSDASWTPDGSPISSTGVTTTYSEAIVSTRFYQVQGL